MAPFEFANSVANTDEFRGLSAKLHHLHFEKGSNGKTSLTMLTLGKKIPQTHIWYAIFQFGIALGKNKRNEGSICIITTTAKVEGATCKMIITIVISGSSYPKTIYGMPQIEIQV